jgi:hypothetical protein
VANCVVHRLEVVKVKEEDADRLADGAPARERMVDAIMKQRPVREVGDWVVEGLIARMGPSGRPTTTARGRS